MKKYKDKFEQAEREANFEIFYKSAVYNRWVFFDTINIHSLENQHTLKVQN